MPLPRTTLRKKWKNGELSCLSEIDVSHLAHIKRKRVWWPCGPAMEVFDQKIARDIDILLKNIDMGEAEIFLRLYMIGKSQQDARPVIMVCCSNAQVRVQADKAIRESDIPGTYPLFGLGASALPLEQPGPVRKLADTPKKQPAVTEHDEANHGSSLGLGDLASKEVNVADPTGPLLGRRIHIANGPGAASPFRRTTGGVVIWVKNLDLLCQVTASHEVDQGPATTSEPSGVDDCYFDGMTDEEEDDDDDGSQRDTGKGDKKIRNDAPGAKNLDKHTRSRPNLTRTRSEEQGGGAPGLSHEPHQPSTSSPTPHSESGVERSLPAIEAPLDWNQRFDPGLDYAIIPLGSSEGVQAGERHSRWEVNKITLDLESNQRTIQIQRVGTIGPEQRNIIAITNPGGVTRGVLIPVPVYFRSAALARFQVLYSVHLRSSVKLGDSGSAIIDEETGDIYGHLVRGVPDSAIAYIVPAVDVFKDLQQKTGSPIQLAVPNRETPLATHATRADAEGSRETTTTTPITMEHSPRSTYVEPPSSPWNQSYSSDLPIPSHPEPDPNIFMAENSQLVYDASAASSSVSNQYPEIPDFDADYPIPSWLSVDSTFPNQVAADHSAASYPDPGSDAFVSGYRPWVPAASPNWPNTGLFIARNSGQALTASTATYNSSTHSFPYAGHGPVDFTAENRHLDVHASAAYPNDFIDSQALPPHESYSQASNWRPAAFPSSNRAAFDEPMYTRTSTSSPRHSVSLRHSPREGPPPHDSGYAEVSDDEGNGW